MNESRFLTSFAIRASAATCRLSTVVYRRHRIEANARAKGSCPYPAAAARLRTVVVRALANSQHEALSAKQLHFALQAELPRYRLRA